MRTNKRKCSAKEVARNFKNKRLVQINNLPLDVACSPHTQTLGNREYDVLLLLPRPTKLFRKKKQERGLQKMYEHKRRTGLVTIALEM
jgi:hypothetical protein